MRLLVVVSHYLFWHYTRAIAEFSRIYRELVSFVFNFFSIKILLRSFFSPWRRMGEDYPADKFDFAMIGSVLIVNTLMRLVGICMRTIIIVMGLAITLVVIVLYPLFLLLWLSLPFVVCLLVLLGVGLIFKI